MIDFAAARRMMVDGQVRTSDVTDLRIIAAMLELPRERFVPEANADDLDVAVDPGRRLRPACGGGPAGGRVRPCALGPCDALPRGRR